MEANASGAVRGWFMVQTNVNVWLTKSGLASTGLTGRAIESPTFLLNSFAIVDPRTTSPVVVEVSSRPCAIVTFRVPQLISAASAQMIVSGTPKLNEGAAPGLAWKP